MSSGPDFQGKEQVCTGPVDYETETGLKARSNITLHKRCKENINDLIVNLVPGVEFFSRKALIPNLPLNNYSQRYLSFMLQ